VSPSDLPPQKFGEALGLSHRYGRPAEVPLLVRDLKRPDLGTRYTEDADGNPGIVERVAAMVRRPPISNTPSAIVCDKTGVGHGVLENFDRARLGTIAITLHGGSSITRDKQRPGYHVSKRDVVTTTQVLLQNGLLKIAPSLEHAATLRRELLNFRVKIDPRTAHDSYEHWREGDHDDLVLAVSCAVWFRQYWNRGADIELARRMKRTRARVMEVGA
jgi:hypothetical protein